MRPNKTRIIHLLVAMTTGIMMPIISFGQTPCDTIRIIQFLQSSEQKRELGEFKEAEDIAREAIECATSLNNLKWIALASCELGIVQYLFRNYTDAQESFSKCQQINESLGDEHIRANLLSYGAAISINQRKKEDVEQQLLEAMHLFEKCGDQKGMVRTEYFLATWYRNAGKYDEALQHFESSLKRAEDTGYTFGIATNHGLMGGVYGNRGQTTDALSHFQTALTQWQQLGNQRGISDNYHMIGAVNFYLSNYAEAMTNYMTALEMRNQIGDSLKIGESYHDIGHIYYKQGYHQEALKNYLASLRIFESTGVKERIAKAHSSIGNAYVALNDYPSAIQHYELGIKIQNEINDKQGLIYSYNNIAAVYIQLNDFEKAEENTKASKALALELGDRQNLSQSSMQLSRLLLESKKPLEAKQQAEEAIQFGLEAGNKDFLSQAYLLLSEIEDTLDHHEEALYAYKNYKLYEDSIRMADKEKVIDELKISYETEKKDHEIQRLENDREIAQLKYNLQNELLNNTQSEQERIRTENTMNLQKISLLDNDKKLQQLELEKSNAENLAQRTEADRKQDQLTVLNQKGELQLIKLNKQTMLKNYLIVGFTLFVLLSFFTYNYFITRQKLKLQTLRNKIASDLHDDVGSTLSSIAIFSEMAQKQSKEVIPLLDTIEENSRKMLDAMADIVWTINPENDQFENIILRMKSYAYELLGAKKIGFDFTADEDVAHIKLPMDVRKNLFLIFKEATNNLVKYADAEKALFSLKSNKTQLSMMIRDNGKGFDVHQLTEGNGLKNMQKRAKEVGGNLLIESLPGGGTTIQFNIAV